MKPGTSRARSMLIVDCVRCNHRHLLLPVVDMLHVTTIYPISFHYIITSFDLLLTDRRADTASCNEEAAGETDGAPASRHAGRTALGLPRTEAGRRAATRIWSGTSRSAWRLHAITCQSEKEVLGPWIEQTEGTKFWLKVMNELRARSVGDILIAAVDGLTGFPDAKCRTLWSPHRVNIRISARKTHRERRAEDRAADPACHRRAVGLERRLQLGHVVPRRHLLLDPGQPLVEVRRSLHVLSSSG